MVPNSVSLADQAVFSCRLSKYHYRQFVHLLHTNQAVSSSVALSVFWNSREKIQVTKLGTILCLRCDFSLHHHYILASLPAKLLIYLVLFAVRDVRGHSGVIPAF